MKLRYRVALISCVLFSCVGCDQATKFAAESMLTKSPKVYLDDMLRLQVMHNRGAFLSLGEALPEFWRTVFFCAGVSILLAAMLLYAVRSKHLSALATIALALCVGGGVSNLVDRLRSSGAVVDFINVGVGGVRTGIFNFADIAIMAGGFLLVISLARKPARA